MPDTAKKSFKREMAVCVALFWAYLVVFGIHNPGSPAIEFTKYSMIPVFLTLWAAFGFDSLLKQGADLFGRGK